MSGTKPCIRIIFEQRNFVIGTIFEQLNCVRLDTLTTSISYFSRIIFIKYKLKFHTTFLMMGHERTNHSPPSSLCDAGLWFVTRLHVQVITTYTKSAQDHPVHFNPVTPSSWRPNFALVGLRQIKNKSTRSSELLDHSHPSHVQLKFIFLCLIKC